MDQEIVTEVKWHSCENGTYLAVQDRFNKRIRIDDYRGDIHSIIQSVIQLTKDHSLIEKIIIKGRKEDLYSLLQLGYTLEGMIPKYFNGNDMYFMVYYMKDDRKRSNYWKKEDEIYENLLEREHIQSLPTLPTMYHIRLANEGDTISLAKLYDNVFQVYPTPLNKSSYIKQVMKEGTIFYVVECEGVIVSAASAEINTTYHNAELTDCATLKQHRTHGLMKHLLTFLEKELIKREIFCAYSLARALSFGMNAAFHQLGYDYQGRLTKNCFIFDKIEDMNIWVKDLSKSI